MYAYSLCQFKRLISSSLGTRIFERLEEDPTYIQRRTKKGNYNRHLQPIE